MDDQPPAPGLTTAVVNRSLGAEVVDRLREGIVTGVLKAGEHLRVTVSGCPVAELVPLSARPRSIPWSAFMQRADKWRADPGLAEDLAALLPGTTDDLPIP